MRDPSVTNLASLGSPSSVSWVMDSTTGTAGGILHQARNAAASTRMAPAAAQGQRARDCRPVTAMEEVLESVKPSTAKDKSSADWKRCAGFFSRQRCTTLCKGRGVAGASCAIGAGSSFRMAVMVSAAVGLRKARVPVSISYRTAPRANRSARWSAASPRTCSGDM